MDETNKGTAYDNDNVLAAGMAEGQKVATQTSATRRSHAAKEPEDRPNKAPKCYGALLLYLWFMVKSK